MLIRSQDKEMIVNTDTTNHIFIGGAYRPNGINYDISADEMRLGYYSTKAKAMKVLDIIQEAYADEKLVDYTTYLQLKEIEKMDDSTILALRNELMKKAVLQIPEDSEVEE